MTRGYRFSALFLVAIAAMAALLYAAFSAAINYSAREIWIRPEYGHALLIPFVVAFLILQRRQELEQTPLQRSWWGVALLLVALLCNLVGVLASLFVVQQYAFVLAFFGVILAFVGPSMFARIFVPLLMVVFMIPLPDFLYFGLSAKLQLISSQIGVWVIRAMGISVFLEGNVIDLGVYKLQVAEACDGLRYLFPLMTLGFIIAYLYRAPMWKRLTLFFSSIPITILMNSLRIGTIGVMVEHWGIGMAEGFLHEFQGWAVFMVSVGVMLVEMLLLSWLGGVRQPLRSVLTLEIPAARAKGVQFESRRIPLPAYAALALVLISAVSMHTLPARMEQVPARAEFAAFPLALGGWSGRSERMESIYLDALMLDDYLMANYVKPDARPVNFYVAWYDSQRAGRSAHSPRSCLPGGGWEIQSLTQVDVPGVPTEGVPLRVNRVLIQLGSQKQLVYYWFQQRGRVVTNEYLVKMYMFWDSLTRNRTDGALVRLTVPISAAESESKAEAQLVEFAAAAARQLDAYVPG